MELKEIRENKRELEKLLTRCVRDFEFTTGVKISKLEIMQTIHSGTAVQAKIWI